MSFAPDILAALQAAAAAHGLDPGTLLKMAQIESGGDPSARTGSYRGLFQLSPTEFAKYSGGEGNIYDPTDNANAAAAKLKAESDQFAQTYGRQPSAGELYLIHQQGEGGAARHWASPDAPAWQNMAATAEGRQKGEDWAKAAIWGNLPDSEKRRFGSVDNVTSKDFANYWEQRVNGSQYASRDGLPQMQPGTPAPGQTTPTPGDANASGWANVAGPNGGINTVPAVFAQTPSETPPASQPTPAVADKNPPGSSPAGGVSSLLGYLAKDIAGRQQTNLGQQAVSSLFGALGAPQNQEANTTGTAPDLSGLARDQVAAQSMLGAKLAPIQFDPTQPVDMSKLQAILATRRGLA